MGWELVKDGKKAKCWLNLDEIKKNKSQYDWQNSIGKKISVRYQWYKDEVEEKCFIVDKCIKSYLYLIDENENKIHIIHISNLLIGQLGRIFNKCTHNFKYEINIIINNLKIINREYKKDEKGHIWKYYQYQCLKCGNIDWICEADLKNNIGCNVCSLHGSKKVLKGYNDIATTHPHLCKYFVNEEDIYKYSSGSSKKVLLQCPDCGYQKNMLIRTFIIQGFGCNKCSDGVSYPEKFMTNILTQLNIEFITQLNHSTFNWCDKYFYDFYLTDYNIIIEMHGGQHYENTTWGIYKETHENDMFKYDLAILNGFEYNKNYFVIDCRKSTLEWMKENIIKELGHIFDLSNIDWEKADLESQKSHMILACQLKKENPNLSTMEIVELIEKKVGIKYHIGTITDWLKKGNKLKLCHYDAQEENRKGAKKRSGLNNPRSRKIVQIDIITKKINKKYNTLTDACKSLKISHRILQYYLKGEKYSCHEYQGYLWFYLDEFEKLSEEELEKTTYKATEHLRIHKRIIQIDLNGNIVKTWKTKNEINVTLGYYLKSYLVGSNKPYKNYLWFYLDEFEKLSEEEFKKIIYEISKYSPTKKVIQSNPITKEVIKIWNGTNEICEELDFKYTTLYGYINGRDKGKPYKGYIWEYVE